MAKVFAHKIYENTKNTEGGVPLVAGLARAENCMLAAR